MKNVTFLAVGVVGLLAACGDNRERCGAGTHAVDGQCVPDGTVMCGQGTVLVDGECILDPEACAEGTVLVDGECVPEDETLTADLEEAAEPNDAQVEGDGIAGELDVPAIGDGVVLHGCVTPYRDADNNGNLDIDFDAWLVHADGPTLLEVTADGVGGLAAGYAVVPTTQESLNAFAWIRFGINLAGDTSQRQLYLPEGGDYVLFMTDSRSLFLQDGAAGDEETCYYTTVAQVEVPTPTPLTVASPGLMAHDGDTIFYSYDPTQRDLLDVDHLVTGAAISASMLTIVEGEVRSISPTGSHLGCLADADEVLVVVDPEYNYALEPQATTTSVFQYRTTAFPTDGSTITVDNVSDEFSFDSTMWGWVDIREDQVVEFDIAFANTDGANWGLLDEDFGVVTVPNDIGDPTTAFSNWVVFPREACYYVALIELDDAEGSFDVTATVTQVTPTPIGLPGGVDNAPLAPYATGWHTFTNASGIWGALSASASGFQGDLQLDLYDRTTAVGVPEYDFTAESTMSFATDGSDLWGRVLSGDTTPYLLRVTDEGGPGLNGAPPTYDLAIVNRQFSDLGTVVDGTPVGATGETLAAGQVRLYFVRATAGDEVTLEVTPTGFDAVLVQLDRDEGELDYADSGYVDDPEMLDGIVIADPTWVAFAVAAYDADESGTFDVEVTASSPVPYVSAVGTVTYADVCSDASAVDLLAGVTGNPDDGLSPAQTLSFDFDLFGAAVPGSYRVSTNGWLALGTPGSSSVFGNASLPSAVLPNGMVAPFWDDLIVDQLCVLDNGTDTATIQWVGVTYNEDLAVEAQAILHADGTIDYVYGPGHAADGSGDGVFNLGATVGLENLSGVFGHTYLFNEPGVAASSSRTLTPAP